MPRATAPLTPKPKPRTNGTMARKQPPNLTPAKPNKSILTFFKKESVEEDLFVQGRISEAVRIHENNVQEREWEEQVSTKRRRTSGSFRDGVNDENVARSQSTPPPNAGLENSSVKEVSISNGFEHNGSNVKGRRKGPFIEESESESEAEDVIARTRTAQVDVPFPRVNSNIEQEDTIQDEFPISSGDFEGFEGIEDFEDDNVEGEEYQAQKWFEKQRLLELQEAFRRENSEANESDEGVCCPLCNGSLSGMSDEQASLHVNRCLDGEGQVPKEEPEIKQEIKELDLSNETSRNIVFRAPKPAQKDPFTKVPKLSKQGSAFSKIMASNAEDAAWANAAAAEVSSRGKPSYTRTCPFYKILPGLSICVDAFRYGAVEGCNAYFLSHFHSDHYIGLTSTWSHGPIYCSRVTANLVRQQLKVDPKYVKALEWEEEVEVPGTNGVKVTMISANHCPGSSLFLFENVIGKGKDPKTQRILHCGDFRACKAHLEHPLLMPNVTNSITKGSKKQKIDVCYLDTTYLNSKYAFPPQEAVIKACGDLCVNLNKHAPDDMLASGVGDTNMKSFLNKSTPKATKATTISPTTSTSQAKLTSKAEGSRLLVIVGTYSIGKERICIGIAQALNTKIYAPPNKMRICTALEDPLLNSLLTKNPHEAQVHMTPLFEIRAETLDDYLRDYRSSFTHAVGFRPTGWNYRPPGSRFTESPSVASVLHGSNWKSSYSVKDMAPQRGSTKRAACYGVPYSEHSSFRELTAFICALRIERVIPTVNVGSAKSREKMRMWVDKWLAERRKNGLFKAEHF